MLKRYVYTCVLLAVQTISFTVASSPAIPITPACVTTDGKGATKICASDASVCVFTNRNKAQITAPVCVSTDRNRNHKQIDYYMIVAQDGSGDYTTIQAAINNTVASVCVSANRYNSQNVASVCASTDRNSTDRVGISTNRNKQVDYYMIVAPDGSGDYTTIQAAINNAKAFPDKRITIFIKNGVYHEKVKVYSWNNRVTLKGESRDSTIISFDDYFDKIDKGRNSTFMTPTLLVQGNDFIAETLTIENTAGPVGQAVALSLEADRCVIRNCALKGNQDTLYTAGEGYRQYFYNCYIEGTTDFIFGEATVVFEKCIIHAKADSYVTAASTPENVKYGYVFKDCELTADQGVTKVYLGRPWRPFAKTVFTHCEMGAYIRPEGWHNWSKPEAEKTTFYAEYNCSGEGFQPAKRVSWSHQLTKRQATLYTLENIFMQDSDGQMKDWYK